MRVLVTGGAGFIGSNFVNRTLKTRTDVEVVILDSLTYAGRRSNIQDSPSRVQFIEGSVLDSALVGNLVASVDVVVHFAAESHNDNSLITPRSFVETNILGTFEILQACLKYSVRYHHISTDEVFGELPLDGKERFDVHSAYNPSSPYSATKAASDFLVRSWVRSFDLQATISNSSNNYGPNQHEEKFVPQTILLGSLGLRPQIYGNGENVRDWIHVDDHNDGVWAILEKGVIGETYLLGANSERTNLQVARAILTELNLPEDFIQFVPDRPGHDLRYSIDASSTREQLGWEPKYSSFEQGLAPVIAHYADLARGGKFDVSKFLSSPASKNF
jgi:dTDP-glucose 4,6-dehydratase